MKGNKSGLPPGATCTFGREQPYTLWYQGQVVGFFRTIEEVWCYYNNLKFRDEVLGVKV